MDLKCTLTSVAKYLIMYRRSSVAECILTKTYSLLNPCVYQLPLAQGSPEMRGHQTPNSEVVTSVLFMRCSGGVLCFNAKVLSVGEMVLLRTHSSVERFLVPTSLKRLFEHIPSYAEIQSLHSLLILNNGSCLGSVLMPVSVGFEWTSFLLMTVC